MRVSGRILIIVGIALTAVSALFCIIGLATKAWAMENGIFCSDSNGLCSQAASALSIISFILLLVSVISLAALLFDLFKGPLVFIPITILFIATIFLLGTIAAFTVKIASAGHSFNLIVAALFFSYVALAITTYWLGQSSAQPTTS